MPSTYRVWLKTHLLCSSTPLPDIWVIQCLINEKLEGAHTRVPWLPTSLLGRRVMATTTRITRHQLGNQPQTWLPPFICTSLQTIVSQTQGSNQIVGWQSWKRVYITIILPSCLTYAFYQKERRITKTMYWLSETQLRNHKRLIPPTTDYQNLNLVIQSTVHLQNQYLWYL
jgi:hypothetical protein